jgi:adenine C2-methylase RlmN of 23S rRNA A2503 and tRNA A37
MGLMGNLFDYEIVEQLYHANSFEKIRNVVFMGMGEPLGKKLLLTRDNYENVLTAIKVMIDTRYFSLSPSKVTVSTVGVVPRLISLCKDLPQIGLALSLHAPTQELRTSIVPTSKAWHIDRIIKVTMDFIHNQNRGKGKKRHVLIEYVLIRDINSSPKVAHDLGKLLVGKDFLLNVIPYNKTAVPFEYEPPTKEECAEFVAIVRSYGLRVLFRQELGGDIASACGQLVIESKGKTCGDGDMEDFGKSSGTKNVAGKRKLNLAKTKEEFKVVEGNLEKNIPQILIQYSILALAIYGTTRYMLKLWS